MRRLFIAVLLSWWFAVTIKDTGQVKLAGPFADHKACEQVRKFLSYGWFKHKVHDYCWDDEGEDS